MVVFVKYAMDDDGRRGKRVGIFRRVFGGPWSHSSVGSHRQSNLSLGPSSPPRERRPLRSVPSVGPQFTVDPEVLAKEYVEKEIKYMGTVTDIAHDFDPSNRTMILSLLDEKQKLGLLPSRLTWRNDAVISFSVYNVKVSWRDGEDLIHRIPTHQIAATGYVQDDSQFYLFIKFASEVDEQMCNLAFFSCESRANALELSFLTQQLFQLVYTNSTMDFFDKSIQDGADTPKHHSCSTDDSTEKKETIRLSLPLRQLSSSPNDSAEMPVVLPNGHHPDSEPPINKSSTLPLFSSQQSNFKSPSPPATSSTPSSPVIARVAWRSESSNGSSLTTGNTNHYQQLQLNEYIEVLRERLTTEELRKFAEHLHHFRKGTLPIKIFCERLMTIYTEQRKSLLLGMRHFIPERRERLYFENFLKRHNIETQSDDVRWWDRPPNSRTLSENEGSLASTTVHVNELSSNSDHVSPSHTSNEDSGEWRAVIGGNKNPDDLKTEVDLSKRSSTAESEAVISPLPLKPTSAEAGDHPDLEPTPLIPEVVLNLEEWDSPILRSGQNKEEAQSPILPRREEIKPSKKKKLRGKSPLTVELGAPYPSMATGGTDDDIDSSLEKKSKGRLKYKRKEKTPRSSSGEKEQKASSNASNDEQKSSTIGGAPSASEVGETATTKKKFFKTKTAKSKEKKEVHSSTSSPLPPEPSSSVLTGKPPRKEHRKKKHKASESTPTTTKL